MFRQITGTVGNMMQNFEDDVLRVKSALESMGRFDFASKPEPHFYVTKELDGSIREYQRDRGLKVDGWMRPGGETERSLSRDMQDKARTEPFVPVSARYSLPPRPEFKPFAGINVNLDKISTGIKNLNQASKRKPAPDAKTKPPEPYGPPAPLDLVSKVKIPQFSEDKEFNRLRENLKPREGGVANRSKKADPGGLTNKGMSQTAYDSLKNKYPGWNLPPKTTDLTDKQITDIFRYEYYQAPGIAKIEKVAGHSITKSKLVEHVFDTGILSGPQKAGELLQQSLDKVLGTDLRETKNGVKYYDGVIGSKTQAVLEKAVKEGKILNVSRNFWKGRDEFLRGRENFKENPGWIDRLESFKE